MKFFDTTARNRSPEAVYTDTITTKEFIFIFYCVLFIYYNFPRRLLQQIFKTFLLTPIVTFYTKGDTINRLSPREEQAHNDTSALRYCALASNVEHTL